MPASFDKIAGYNRATTNSCIEAMYVLAYTGRASRYSPHYLSEMLSPMARSPVATCENPRPCLVVGYLVGMYVLIDTLISYRAAQYLLVLHTPSFQMIRCLDRYGTA